MTTTDSASAAQDFVAPASIVPGVTIGDVLDGHVPDCPTPCLLYTSPSPRDRG